MLFIIVTSTDCTWIKMSGNANVQELRGNAETAKSGGDLIT